MRYLLLLVMAMLASSCSRCCQGLPEWFKYPTLDTSYFRFPWSDPAPPALEEIVMPGVDGEEVTRLIITYATELCHEHHLFLEQSRVRVRNGEIALFHVELSSQNLVVIRDGRELLVDVVEGLLDRIKKDEFLAGYLPPDFGPKNLEIYINLESYWALYGDQMYLGWIVLQDARSYFYAADLKDKLYDYTFWHDRVEEYSKSVEIVTFSRAAEKAYEKKQEAAKEPKLKEELYLK